MARQTFCKPFTKVRVRYFDHLDAAESWMRLDEVKWWANTLNLSWSIEEINDVVNYMNQQYYKMK